MVYRTADLLLALLCTALAAIANNNPSAQITSEHDAYRAAEMLVVVALLSTALAARAYNNPSAQSSIYQHSHIFVCCMAG